MYVGVDDGTGVGLPGRYVGTALGSGVGHVGIPTLAKEVIGSIDERQFGISIGNPFLPMNRGTLGL
jgi:hypothetical protein